jgi:hypothetical protein
MREPPAPSWSDLAAMMAAMAPRVPPAPEPPAERDDGIKKWVLGVVASFVVVAGTYAGSTLAGVGSLGHKIETLTDRFGDLAKSVDELTTQSGQQQIAISKQDMRVSRLEQDQARLMDRMRTVEGGSRIFAPAPGAAGAP